MSQNPGRERIDHEPFCPRRRALDFPATGNHPDGMEMLHVFPTAAVHQIVQIANAPAVVHPFGDKAYEVLVGYDCLNRSDLTLKVAFKEDGDNGDGVTNEIYEALAQAVAGSTQHLFYVWIPNADQNDSDYISTPDGGSYEFAAWLEDGTAVHVADAIPQETRLEWGVRPTASLPNVRF